MLILCSVAFTHISIRFFYDNNYDAFGWIRMTEDLHNICCLYVKEYAA